MNPWNRLFVVIAICWVIVSPLLIATEADRGPAQALHDCSDSAYQQSGQATRLGLTCIDTLQRRMRVIMPTLATVSVFRERLARCSAVATGYLG
jgi:hypothetical protein